MYLKSLAFSALFVFHLAYADTPSGDPKTVVEEIFQKAAKKSVEHNSSLQEEINRNIDFSQMAQKVLGEEKKNHPNQEIEWFDHTLKEIITRTVYPEAPKFLHSVKISYKTVKQEGDSAKVSSVVRNKGESTDVDYTLRRIGDSWRVVDVSIDGESWVQTISDQVQRTLKKQNWQGLKQRLDRRLASLKSGKKIKSKVNDEGI